jgi:hypothetical protein
MVTPDRSMVLLGVVLMSFGARHFISSLRQMTLRRRFMDIGTSRISSAALGDSVEINAEVISEEQTIESPLSGKKCVAFIWHIERKIGFGNRKSWYGEFRFHSTPFFYVTDESAEVAAVDLASCSFDDSLCDFQISFKRNSDDVPRKALHLLKLFKLLGGKAWLGPHEYRITEKVIKPGEKMYIFGSAAVVPASEASRVKEPRMKFDRRHRTLIQKVKRIFRAKQNDLDALRNYDLNFNGRLDQEESLQLYYDIKRDILAEYGMTSLNRFLKRAKFLLVGSRHKGIFLSTDKVFVSEKSKAQLLATLRERTFLSFFGGPAMFVIGAYIIWTAFF